MDDLLPNCSFLVISIWLFHCFISDASTAAVTVTQSPWIQATYPRRNAISRHDARLPLTAANTKIQSLQTASSAARLITYALPNPATAISNARAVGYGTTTINGTTTSWTITYVATIPWVTNIMARLCDLICYKLVTWLVMRLHDKTVQHDFVVKVVLQELWQTGFDIVTGLCDMDYYTIEWHD